MSPFEELYSRRCESPWANSSDHREDL